MSVLKNIVYYMVCGLLKLLSFIFFPCKAVGVEKIPKGKNFILCPNHISWFDVVPINMAYMRPMNYMAKIELFKNKFVGGILGFFGAFPVNRGAGDKGALDRAGEMLKTDKPMCIFVEGTRTHNADASPGRAKSGAVLLASQAGCDLVPVAIVYKHGRPRLFSSTTVYFGEPLKAEEIKMDGVDRAALRRVSTEIMKRITDMWKAGTEKCRK